MGIYQWSEQLESRETKFLSRPVLFADSHEPIGPLGSEDCANLRQGPTEIRTEFVERDFPLPSESICVVKPRKNEVLHITRALRGVVL